MMVMMIMMMKHAGSGKFLQTTSPEQQEDEDE